METVFITGGTGFIGKNIIELLHKKYKIITLSRNILDDVFWHEKQVVRYRGTISDVNMLQTIFHEHVIDHVIHLVTYYKPQHELCDINEMLLTNVSGLVNLLEIMQQTKINHLINTSTCFEYAINTSPKNSIPLKESSKKKPWNLYALTKIMANQAIDYYTSKFDLSAITLRLFPPFGIYDNPAKFIPYVIQKALKNEDIMVSPCEQKWDYVYSKDIALAYEKALEYHQIGHDIFNISYSNQTTLRSIIDFIIQQIGSASKVMYGQKPYRPNEIMVLTGDNSKAKQLLDWNPNYTLFEGITETIDYYKELN